MCVYILRRGYDPPVWPLVEYNYASNSQEFKEELAQLFKEPPPSE